MAFALQADGWWLRSDIIWSKPNPMPESVRDRPTRAHEYIFLMAKAQKYYYDADTIAEPAEFIGPNGPGRKGSPSEQNFYRIAGKNRSINGPITRNRRSVWTVTTKPFKEAHFATFPPEIPTLCIKAGCPKGGTVLDPFCGAGTAGMIAKELGMDFIGIELNPKYCQMAERRIAGSVYQMEIEDKEKT